MLSLLFRQQIRARTTCLTFARTALLAEKAFFFCSIFRAAAHRLAHASLKGGGDRLMASFVSSKLSRALMTISLPPPPALPSAFLSSKPARLLDSYIGDHNQAYRECSLRGRVPYRSQRPSQCAWISASLYRQLTLIWLQKAVCHERKARQE